MSSLSEKSAKEMSELLDEYGIKHGPIVDSTRKLYEKKLSEAMAKETTKPSSDKTYYREEQEEVTYVRYRAPVRHEGFGDVTRRSGTIEYTDDVDDGDDGDDGDYANEPAISRNQTTYQNVSRSRSTPLKSVHDRPAKETTKSGGVPGWLRVLVFVIIAVFLYYVYSNMEDAEDNPFKKIEG